MTRALLICVLALSVAANVWFALKWRATSRQPVVTPPAVETRAHSLDTGTGRKPTATPAATHLTSEPDFRAVSDHLLAAGISPEVVRAAVAVMIHREFQRRREALLGRPAPDEYWRNRSPRMDLVDQAAMRELDREQRRLIREVAGSDAELDDHEQRRQYGGLPEEKVKRLKKIFEDYSDLEEQLFSDTPDRGSPDARARATLLAKEKRADVERLLTAEELLNYDLRNSPSAHRLRGQLGQFQVTEAEFLALYPVHKAAVEAEAAMGPRSGVDVRRAREATERQLDAEMRKVLGEARYAEMKEATDPMLQQTRSFANSTHLPPATTAELITLQKDFSPRLAAVERDRDLTPNQRDAQLYALGVEARERLTRLLGPSGFEAYKRRGGGWLGAALSRAPPTPPPTP